MAARNAVGVGILGHHQLAREFRHSIQRPRAIQRKRFGDSLPRRAGVC